MEHTKNSNSQPEQFILTKVIQPLIEEQRTATLAEVVPLLLDFLNRACSSNVEDYEIAPYGRFGSQDEPENEVSIEIYFDPDMPELNKRDLWTLLRKSGSERTWMSADENTANTIEDPYQAPLRFKLLRSFFHMGWHNQSTAYLVIDHLGKLDSAAAERQIALLIGYLDDVLNLDEVPPEVRWMFEALPSTTIQPGDDERDEDHSYQDIEADRDTIIEADDEDPSPEED